MTPPDTKSAEEQAWQVVADHLDDTPECADVHTECYANRAEVGEGECSLHAIIAAALREAKIEAWQKAAQAVCSMCRAGEDDLAVVGNVLPVVERGPAGNWDHPSLSVPDWYATCLASPIHALIAAASPPRVAEEGEK